MTDKDLAKYIKTYFTLFDFVNLDFDVDAIIKEEREKDVPRLDQNMNIKNRVKLEVKSRIKKRFLEDKNSLFKDIMTYKISSNNYPEYTKARIIDLTFSVIDSIQKNDDKFYDDFIKKNKEVKLLLNLLFLEETDDNEVENELVGLYKHLKPLIKVYKEKYYEKENAGHNLSFKQVKELIDKAREGDLEARNELVVNNIGLCKKLAYSHLRKDQPLLNLDDLIQDGVEGLFKAIEKYDYKKGTRFSTFAVFWIRQGISRSIENNGRVIRIPVFKQTWINKCKREIAELMQKDGTIDYEEAVKRIIPTKEKQDEYKNLTMRINSLSEKISHDGDEKDGVLGDIIPSSDNVEEKGISAAEKEELYRMLDEVVSPRQRDVLIRRFGIGTGEEETLEEIAKSYNITRERVRQIEARALTRLNTYVCTNRNVEPESGQYVLRRHY